MGEPFHPAVGAVAAGCPKCGAPHPPELAADLGALPRSVLCPACADTPQTPMSTRTFRVSLVIEERTAGGAAPTEGASEAETDVYRESTGWDVVGRFTITGTAQSVGQFASEHADEFGKRMQMILDFADDPG